MADQSYLSTLNRISLVCLILGFPCLVFAVGFPAWIIIRQSPNFYSGLWLMCNSRLSDCTFLKIGLQEAWFTTVRWMEVLAVILYVLTFGLRFKLMCGSSQDFITKTTPSIVMSIATGMVSLIGAVVYRVFTPIGLFVSLSYSFWVVLVGSLAPIVSGVILIVLRHRSNRLEPTQNVQLNKPGHPHPGGGGVPGAGPIYPANSHPRDPNLGLPVNNYETINYAYTYPTEQDMARRSGVPGAGPINPANSHPRDPNEYVQVNKPERLYPRLDGVPEAEPIYPVNSHAKDPNKNVQVNKPGDPAEDQGPQVVWIYPKAHTPPPNAPAILSDIMNLSK